MRGGFGPSDCQIKSSHLAVERRIRRPVDLPHPALANESGHVVVAEAGAGGERHPCAGLYSQCHARVRFL